MAEFTHLHLHTDFSLLDGACDVDKLVKRVQDIGQTSVAITDHGNIYGAVHFFEAAKKQGIKPILGPASRRSTWPSTPKGSSACRAASRASSRKI